MPENSRIVSGTASLSHAAITPLLARYGVSPETIDPTTLRYQAVPVSRTFNKQRTHLLLRRLRSGCRAFVDCDLEYRGEDRAVRFALTGPCRRKWRRLRLPPLPAPFADAFFRVAELLGSPLLDDLQRIRQQNTAAPGRPQRADERGRAVPGRMLAALADPVSAETCAKMFQSSFRQPLACELALLTNRPSLPRSALLWGLPGAGRDHLMLAAAHPLFEKGHIQKVFRLPATRISAGCVFPAEVDASLMAILSEAVAEEGLLLIVQNLDVCLTRSATSGAVLADALDSGLRMLATVWDTGFLRLVRQEEALARRFVAVHVPPPSHQDTRAAVERLVEASALDVAPAAVEASIRTADKQPLAQPAAALNQMAAALSAANWHGRAHVCPDDVLTVLQSEWPD